MTDLFADNDLKIPELTSESQLKIAKILPEVNVNIKNPIDLGASGFVLDIFTKCIEIAVKDPNIDFVIIPLWPHHVHNHVFKRMIKICKMSSKPFAFCLPSIADDAKLAQRFNSSKKLLHDKRVLYYLSLRDAAKSISLLWKYSNFLKSQAVEGNR